MSQSGKIQCIILGWTGVILDDEEVINQSHINTIKRLGEKIPTDDLGSKIIHISDWETFYKNTVGINSCYIKSVPRIFSQEYKKYGYSLEVVPNINEILRKLKNRGMKLVLFSNIPKEALLFSMEKLDLHKYFDAIIVSGFFLPTGSDQIRKFLIEQKLQPTETVMIGASETNIRVGLEIGLITAGVGPNNFDNSGKPDFRIQDLTFLSEIIDESRFLKATPTRIISSATPEFRQFIENRYTQKLNGGLTRIPTFYHADNRAFAHEILSRGIIPERARIADIGTGTSIYSQVIARNHKGIAVNLDLSYQALSCSNSINDGNSISALRLSTNGDAAHLPFPNTVFDLIICAETLEHVIDDDVILAELRRVLKPEGYLVISVPNIYESVLPLFRNLHRKFNTAGHVREYDMKRMKELLENNQLKVIHIQSTGFFIFWLLISIERSSLSRWVKMLLRGKYQFNYYLERFFADLITKENQVLGNLVHFGLRNHFLVRFDINPSRKQ